MFWVTKAYKVELWYRSFLWQNSKNRLSDFNILLTNQKVFQSENRYFWASLPQCHTLPYFVMDPLPPCHTPKLTNSVLKISRSKVWNLGLTFAKICIFYSKNVLPSWANINRVPQRNIICMAFPLTKHQKFTNLFNLRE